MSLWQQLQGCDLHLHTCFSDGEATPRQLLEACVQAGLWRIAVTDHCEVGHAADMSHRWDDYVQTLDALRSTAEQLGIALLIGLETGIGPDGMPKSPEKALTEADLVIASVHQVNLRAGETVDSLPTEVYWERYREQLMLAAQAPYVDIIGHVEGYLVTDWKKLGGRTFAERRQLEKELATRYLPLSWYADLASVAAAHGVAVELHGLSESPRADVVRVLQEGGVKFSLGSDAHALRHVSMKEHVKFLVETLHLQPTDFAPFVGLEQVGRPTL